MANLDVTASSNWRPYVGGSATTTFRWAFPGQTAQVIAFASQVQVTEPPPVADPQVIHPLDKKRPVEIVTAGAQTNGTITLTLTQLYNESVWQRLAGLANSQDITDITRTIAGQNGGLQIVRRIEPLVPNHPAYEETYFNCVIQSVGDDMPVTIETMSVTKDLTLWFTHSIKGFVNGGSQQFTDSGN